MKTGTVGIGLPVRRRRAGLAWGLASAAFALAVLAASGIGAVGPPPAVALGRRVLEALLPPPRTVPDGRRALLLSDEPETVRAPGILYADTFSGPFRVYLYAVNGTARPLRVGVVAANPGGDTVRLQVGREGRGGPTAAAPQGAAEAEAAFFRAPVPRTLRLPPGTAAFVSPPGAVTVPAGEMLNAIVDVASSAPVRVATVAAGSAAAAIRWLTPARPGTRPSGSPGVLPAARLQGDILRGTFAHADWRIAVAVFPWQRRVVIPGGAFLHGVSAVDGVPVRDRGDYGVLFRVRAAAYEPTPGTVAQLALLASARWAARLTGFWLATWGLLPPGAAGPLAARITESERGPLSRLAVAVSQRHWMAPGGTNLPRHLFLRL